MKPMTLKECKKEEKADREFQKKFKVSSTERFCIPLTSLLLPRSRAPQRPGCTLSDLPRAPPRHPQIRLVPQTLLLKRSLLFP